MNPIPKHPTTADTLRSLEADYARAKAAERELQQARKVIWLLLRQIGEPVVIDEVTLLAITEDVRTTYVKDPAGFITLSAL